MRTLLLIAACVIVLAANGWALFGSWQNRRESRGGTVELTERELRLQPMLGESTVTLLRLEWDTLSNNSRNRHQPEWLDQAKLVELGFDCSVAATNPMARRHYASIPASEVVLVLEYGGETWRKAEARGRTRSRLLVIDAGRDARGLRQKYPSDAGFVLTRGVVQPWFQDWDEPRRTRLAVPRIQGLIQALLPTQIFVPRPHSDPLAPFRHRDLNREREEETREPRFAATVSWGSDYEPWVKGVRVLAPGMEARPGK